MHAFERTLLASPEDEQAWRVWADYLQTQGDPRGECIALELAGHDSDELLATRSEGLELAPQRWQAALRDPTAKTPAGWPLLDAMLDGYARVQPAVLDCRWDRGMLDAAQLTDPWNPVDGLPPTAELLDGLLRAPCALLLRELGIDRHSPSDVASGTLGKRGVLEWALSTLEAHELPRLERLSIGGKDDSRARLSSMSNYMLTTAPPGYPDARIVRPDRWIGELSGLLARLPGLRRLALCGEGVQLSQALRLPLLEQLQIRTRFLRASVLETLGRCELPRVVTLELWLGNWPDSSTEFEGPEGERYYGPEPTAELLAPLLRPERLPALRHLRLRHCAYAEDLVLFLLDRTPASALDRLGRIDLSGSEIAEPQAARLRERFGPRVVL